MILRFVANPQPAAMATSPLLEALGAHLDGYDTATRMLRMSFTPPQMFRQGAGVVQGGALSMMLDFVLAFSAMAAIGKAGSVATVGLSTDFMGAARGENIAAEGVVTKAGRTMVFARAWLKDGERQVAAAQSSLVVVPA